jgi:hypothetical protein
MADEKPSRLRRFVDTFSRLSPAMLAVVGVVLAAGLGGGGYYAFRAYDYGERASGPGLQGLPPTDALPAQCDGSHGVRRQS